MRYEIKGDTLPVVICYLENGERMITERGSMSWMSPNMKMETTSNGGIGKAFGRMFSGEALFQNRYTATGGNGMIAFASSFPGQIVARQIAPGQELCSRFPSPSSRGSSTANGTPCQSPLSPWRRRCCSSRCCWSLSCSTRASTASPGAASLPHASGPSSSA